MVLLRPAWLLMLIPLAVIALWYWRRKRGSRNWAAVIDPLLLPHLLTDEQGQRRRWPFFLALALALLMIIALAGPAWQKLPQPVFKQQSALVIALDLSASMNAADIKPSRLQRVRLKLIDLLKQRKEGQTALIAYAGTAYTVTPLTDDYQTILSLLPSLTTDIMPAPGSRPDLAVARATQLFDNAGVNRGDILLVTDGVNERSLQQLSDWHVPAFRLSVLAVGSEQGAPIPVARGGFLKDANGEIVIARTNRESLQTLAAGKGGVYVDLRIDNADIQTVQALVDDQGILGDHSRSELTADRWQEEGPWLLLLVTPLAALAFRRGFMLTLLLTVMVLPVPQPARAEVTWWDRLWNNRQQLAAEELQQGEAQRAAELFEPGEWKAAAHYRAGQYDEALAQLEHSDSIAGLYNRGNTLARLGKLEEALEQYDRVLERDPEHEDAAHNRQLVEQALKQRQQQSSQDERQQQEQDQQQEQQQQDSQDQQDEQDQQDQQQGEQQQQDQQSGQQDQQNEQAGQGEQQQQDSEQQQNDAEAIDQQAQKDRMKQQQQQNGDSNEQEQRDQHEGDDEQQQAQRLEAEQEQQEADQDPNRDEGQPGERNADQLLSEQAEEQWLRRIDDDPGGLLRNKFRYQYGLQSQPPPEQEPW